MGNSLIDENTEEELWHEFKQTKSPAIRDKFNMLREKFL